jgi:hypothetical protein
MLLALPPLGHVIPPRGWSTVPSLPVAARLAGAGDPAWPPVLRTGVCAKELRQLKQAETAAGVRGRIEAPRPHPRHPDHASRARNGLGQPGVNRAKGLFPRGPRPSPRSRGPVSRLEAGPANAGSRGAQIDLICAASRVQQAGRRRRHADLRQADGDRVGAPAGPAVPEPPLAAATRDTDVGRIRKRARPVRRPRRRRMTSQSGRPGATLARSQRSRPAKGAQ